MRVGINILPSRIEYDALIANIKSSEDCDIKATKLAVRNKLHSIRSISKRKQAKALNDFRTKWFVWRSSVSVSRVTNISVENILFGSTVRKICNPRHVCLWVARELGHLSYSGIGRVVGRDHSTVASSCSLVERAIEQESGMLWDILTDTLFWEYQCHSKKLFQADRQV